MKKLIIVIFVTLLLWTTDHGLWTANAAVPHLINYQGRLTDSSGAPLTGSYSLTFRIYDAETAGNLLWEETHQGVVIQKGIFSILLGSVTDLNLAFDKPYFLEIKVGNEVMSPRQRITSAGYAIRAENLSPVDNNVKLPAMDGSQLANLNASNLASGTVPTARLGSGTADATKFLRGDQSWQEIPNYNYIAGDHFIATAGIEQYTQSASYIKIKEIIIGQGGTLRIKFDLRRSTSGATAYGRIYRNGVAVGTEQSTNSWDYVTYSEDISNWSRGDLVQLYYKISGPGVVYIKNFFISVAIPVETITTMN